MVQQTRLFMVLCAIRRDGFLTAVVRHLSVSRLPVFDAIQAGSAVRRRCEDKAKIREQFRLHKYVESLQYPLTE